MGVLDSLVELNKIQRLTLNVVFLPKAIDQNIRTASALEISFWDS
jgi:hypothetical protein